MPTLFTGKKNMSIQLDLDSRYTATRQKILDEAYKIVLEHGIDHLSMRSIATAVHSSPANLYEYFASKDEIIYELHTKLFQELTKYLKTVDQQLSPTEYLEQLGIAYLDFVQQHSVFLKLQSHYNIEYGYNSRMNADKDQENGHHRAYDRTKPLFEMLQGAIQRQFTPHSQTTSEQICSEQVYGIPDRTVAYWSLLHGYATLMGLTVQPEFTTNRWRSLFRQFMVSN